MRRIVRFTPKEVTHEAIAQRAYEIWQARGCPDGDGQADWRAAEAELLAENAPRRRRPLQRLLRRLRSRAASF